MTEQQDAAIRSFEITRVSGDDAPSSVRDNIVAEQAVTISVADLEDFTLLCTPLDTEALAVGFLFAEAVIDSADEIEAISSPSPDVVKVTLKNPPEATARRNLTVASSCGLCGTRNLKRLLYSTNPCGSSLAVSRQVLFGAMEKLSTLQRVFKKTGGAHAAAIFDSTGEVVSFGEDLGRHSALDKAIGKAMLSGKSTKGCGVALSGRVSFEMALKSARAGIELIAAVSAPSSLAVESAAQWNITLCGFVRSGRANIYTHPKRVK